jgi:hypothetical protein
MLFFFPQGAPGTLSIEACDALHGLLTQQDKAEAEAAEDAASSSSASLAAASGASGGGADGGGGGGAAAPHATPSGGRAGTAAPPAASASAVAASAAAAAAAAARRAAAATSGDALRAAALSSLIRALPLLPAKAVVMAAADALMASARLSSRAARAAAAAPLAAACLALAARPDLIAAVRGKPVLPIVLPPAALNALYTSSRPFCEEFCAALLLAAAGDAHDGTPGAAVALRRGGAAWLHTAIEAAEAGVYVLPMDFRSAHSGSAHSAAGSASPPALVPAALVALAAVVAPPAAAAGGEAASRLQAVLRSTAAAMPGWRAPELRVRALTLVRAAARLRLRACMHPLRRAASDKAFHSHPPFSLSVQLAHHLQVSDADVRPLADAARQLLAGDDASVRKQHVAVQAAWHSRAHLALICVLCPCAARRRAARLRLRWWRARSRRRPRRRTPRTQRRTRRRRLRKQRSRCARKLRCAFFVPILPASIQSSIAHFVPFSAQALGVLVARLPPRLRRDAAPLLRAALLPFVGGGGGGGARSEACAPPLAALFAVLSRAEGTANLAPASDADGDADGLTELPRPGWALPPAPPAAFAPCARRGGGVGGANDASSAADAALMDALLEALHASGVDARLGGGARPAPLSATPPRPFGTSTLVTAPSDPYQVFISHDLAPSARRIGLQCVPARCAATLRPPSVPHLCVFLVSASLFFPQGSGVRNASCAAPRHRAPLSAPRPRGLSCPLGGRAPPGRVPSGADRATTRNRRARCARAAAAKRAAVLARLL